MQSLSSLIVGKPQGIIVVCFLLTGFFAYHAQHLQLDSSVESLLAENDPGSRFANSWSSIMHYADRNQLWFEMTYYLL